MDRNHFIFIKTDGLSINPDAVGDPGILILSAFQDGIYAKTGYSTHFFVSPSLIGQCERTLSSMPIIKEWRITQVACKFTKFSIANLNVLTCARLQRKRQRLIVSNSSPSCNVNTLLLPCGLNVFTMTFNVFYDDFQRFLRWLSTFLRWLSTFLRWLSN